MIPGRCIQICGVNNVGKSTVTKHLETYLRSGGLPVHCQKFPVYEGVQGEFIWKYLRDPVFRKEYHSQHSQDARLLFLEVVIAGRLEKTVELKARLAAGEWVIVDSGLVSSIAWALIYGMSEAEAFSVQAGLIRGDVGILLNEKHGRRYKQSIEVGHASEENDAEIQVARSHMLRLVCRQEFPYARVNFEIEETERAVFKKVLAAIRRHIDLPSARLKRKIA